MANIPVPSKTVVEIKLGETLTFATDGVSTARYALVSDPNTPPSGMTSLSTGATVTLGPYNAVKYVHLEALTGGPTGVSFTISADDRTKIGCIGDMSSLRFISGSGAPSGSTGQNVAGGASLYFDLQNSALYLNVGSASSPSWKAVSHA
jgi:hypothetical protein